MNTDRILSDLIEDRHMLLESTETPAHEASLEYSINQIYEYCASQSSQVSVI